MNIRGLFNPKAILVEELQWYYLGHFWGERGFHNFPKGSNPKVNFIGLVSLFNGKSTFMGYLMPKP